MRALAILLLTTPALSAFGGNNELSVGSNFRSLHTDSANAVTDQGLDGGWLTYARALDIALYPKLTLWAEGGWSTGGADGTMFQTMATHLESTTFTAGVRARYMPYRGLAVSGRFSLGSAKTSLSLDDGHGSASDSGWGAITTGALAADFIGMGRRYGFGLRFELGYVAGTGVSLTPHRDSGDPDALKLPMQTQSFGSLNLSGAFLNVGLVSEF